MDHCACPGVKVETEYGPIEGFVHEIPELKVTANIFLGVPYATPPVGELRFERPVPPTPWKDVRPAKCFRNSCPPYIKAWIQNSEFSEDCLYLNFMAPHSPSQDPKGYPVLVYIHGGAFCFGDVIKAGYDKLTRNFVSRGVLVVTVPYRVGVYGFFTTGTKEDEGNIGLWDQTMALKFVKKNIKQFGGNPDNITIWGQSAGAAAVDLLTLSPHSRDLFNKVCQSSGSAFNNWATSNPSIRCTFRLAEALGCESKDPAEVKAFLKKVSSQEIMDASSTKFKASFTTDVGDEDYIVFGPRLDDSFFDGKTLEQLFDEAPPKPTLLGVMSMECISFVFGSTPQEKIKTYCIEDAKQLIDTSICPRSQAKDELEPMKKELIDFYTTGINHPLMIFQKSIEMCSDQLFTQSVLKDAELKAEKNWEVYFYIWDYTNASVAKMIPVKGAMHSSELHLLFDQKPSLPIVLTEDDAKITSNFSEILSNFCKNGNPSTSFIDFPRYDLKDRKTLWFNLESEVREDPLKNRRIFWTDFVKKYNFNSLRYRTKEQIKTRYSW